MDCAAQRNDHRLDASELRELLRAATAALERRAASIDRLNVFPVPDGDTGSNMVHGMRSALAEASASPATDAAEVAAAFARGALAGARGSSGLILSQFWEGLARALKGSQTAGIAELARGLRAGCELAFRAVSRPVPGTILTVMEEVAAAAEAVADGSLSGFLHRVAAAAKQAVARTPQLLEVLRRSGVVDAGAEGLHRILEGAWSFARKRAGESPAPEEEAPEPPEPPRLGLAAAASSLPAGSWPHGAVGAVGAGEAVGGAYGFCTEFFIHGSSLEAFSVREALQGLGESFIVTQAGEAVRVHLHTRTPQAVLERAGALGRVEQVSVRDMDVQHREFAGAATRSGGQGDSPVLALVPGEGLAAVFRSLGAGAALVWGGEESVLRRVLAGMPAGDLLLIPNDPDPRRVGEQVQPLTDRRVHVVEARTVPQGVAAMVAFASESGLHENFQRMREAAARARSIEVREQPRGGQAEPRAVGLLEGAQVAEGQGLGEALAKVVQAALGSAGARQAEERGSAAPAAGRVTLFYGFGVGPQEAEDLRTGLLRDQPSLEVEALPGGQPGRGLLVWLE